MEYCISSEKDLVYINVWQLSCSISTSQCDRASSSSYIVLFHFTEGSKKKPSETVQNVSLTRNPGPMFNYKVLNANIRLGLLT